MTDGNTPNMAEMIYEARKRLGLSQQRVGDAVGVTQQTVAAWENGGKVPGPDKWAAIEAVLEFPAGTLADFYGVVSMAPDAALIRELEREARDLRKEAERAIRRAAAATERLERLRGDGGRRAPE